jgi:hypothetical protein
VQRKTVTAARGLVCSAGLASLVLIGGMHSWIRRLGTPTCREVSPIVLGSDVLPAASERALAQGVAVLIADRPVHRVGGPVSPPSVRPLTDWIDEVLSVLRTWCSGARSEYCLPPPDDPCFSQPVRYPRP